MANTMTIEEMKRRVISLLPPWFDDSNPVRDSLINAIAYSCYFVDGLYQYAKLQTRINTASGIFLDLIAQDFFGASIQRADGQSDDNFRKVILANLFRERATRHAIEQAILDTTDNTGSVFEFLKPSDTGAYGVASGVCAMGYNLAGGYGSMSHPYEALIYASRKAGVGVPYVAGYGIPLWGYGKPSQGEYVSESNIETKITDSQIYQAIENVRPVATKLWVQLSGSETGTAIGQFVLDDNTLI